MRSGAAGCLSCGVILLSLVTGDAQEPIPGSIDPRIGLTAGFRDAGIAARNIELIASLPKPEGFFDPKAPAGFATPPEETREEEEAVRRIEREHERAGTPAPPRPGANNLNQANSDLAFRQSHVFVGNFHGFNVYDIESPGKPRQLASVVCPGGQGDVSVHGNLLFMSVEQSRGRIDCGTGGVQAPDSAERFRGIRIFDVSDIRRPKQIAAVQTCRGSHTHTLVADPDDTRNLYVYGSGTGRVRSAKELEDCSPLDPQEDPNTALFSIDVIEVPLAAPQKARIVSRPRIFADRTTGAIAGLWKGGDHGPGTQRARATNQCHDLTVFPELGLAAGACSGNGILLDISDPINPVRLDEVLDKNFAYWHSATFNNDGSKVIFTDEWGGGIACAVPRQRSPNMGRQRDFRHRRSEAALRRVLQTARSTDGAGKLRGPQRVAGTGARPRHHGAGVVPGRRVDLRFHRFGQAVRDRVLRSRPARREPVDYRRVLVGLLVQRTHLRDRDRARVSMSSGCGPASISRRTRSTPPCSRMWTTSIRSSSAGSPGRR